MQSLNTTCGYLLSKQLGDLCFQLISSHGTKLTFKLVSEQIWAPEDTSLSNHFYHLPSSFLSTSSQKQMLQRLSSVDSSISSLTKVGNSQKVQV